MKYIVLSDFTAEQLKKRAAERERQYASAVQEYEAGVQARQARIDSLMERRGQAGHLRAVGYTCSILWARFGKMIEARRRKPVKQQAGVVDEIWEYGHEGEERVRDYLDRQLDDSYTLLVGYRNPGGEIDAIVVGPSGVTALEIKGHKGLIECDGDDWKRNKFDSYGNLVACGEPMVDRGGRSPARQLNEPSDRLQSFLARTVEGCRIFRAVVLADQSAVTGVVKNPTVDGVFLLHDWDLQAMFSKNTTRLTSGDVDRTIRQIQRDHNFWEKKRNPGNAPGGSRM